MELNYESLRYACFSAAKKTMWDVRPTDLAKIENLAREFHTIALSHLDEVLKQGRDSNILVRAVTYLANTHAIPPMHDNREWFIFMLRTLVELSCPKKDQTAETAEIFSDIEAGIIMAREAIGEPELTAAESISVPPSV
jgi:hypothetical protein